MNPGQQSFPPSRWWNSFLLDRHPKPLGTSAAVERSPIWQMPLLVLALFALMIAGSGSAIYLSAKRSVTQATHDRLEAIAKLKVADIEYWLDGRREDAQLVINTPLFVAELQHWLKGSRRDNQSRERLLDHLKRMTKAGHYRDVSIRAATDGALLLTSSGLADAVPNRKAAMAAARQMKPILDDLHFVAAGDTDTGIDFYIPITLAGLPQVLAVVDIQDNPADFLFPLLSRRPGSSPSAETLIFKIDGQDVVYLNSPRHGAKLALHLRLSAAHPDLLAAQAARGKMGPLTGVDYRNVSSLGYALPVAGTTWHMIAKIDTAESYALLNWVAFVAAVVAAALLFLAAWWMFTHRRHTEASYRHHFELKLLHGRIDFLSRYSNDAMVLTDLTGVIVEANDRLSAIYGYTHEELIGMSVIELRPPQLRADLQTIKKAMLESEDLLYETEGLHKDGHTFPTEAKSRMIEIDGERYFQAIVRDVTERQQAAARIHKLSQLRAAISEINNAIIHSQSPGDVYQAVCQACIEHGGFLLAWIGIADAETQRINPIQVAGPASGYIDGIVISTRSDIPGGQGPTAVAYREQRVYLCNDFSADPAIAPWRDHAATYGLRSSIALPLLRGGNPYGALMAYGSKKDFFDEESVTMLVEMAQNISFAIGYFDRQAQRRQAANDLRRSEEKFRALVEHLPQNVFIKDSDSIYVSCNSAYARTLGINPDQIAGLTDYEFFPTELAEKYRSDDRRVLTSGGPHDIDEEYMDHGQRKIIHTVKAPVRNEQGQTVGVLGIFWDVTESKRAEQALRHYADEIEDLYQNAPCGYHSISADGTIVRINNTELRWLGYARAEVVGCMNILDILSATSRQSFTMSFPQFKKTGSLQNVEMDFVRKDGTILPAILSATAVFDADGRYVSSRTTVYDITERKQLERERTAQTQRMAELSQRLVAVQEEERRRLAGELHDRASPNLAAIKITLGTLAGSLPDQVLADAESCLEDAQALLDDTTAGIREICSDLRPPVLDYAGLTPALIGYAAQFMKRTSVVVRVKSPQMARLDSHIESTLFRIVQEALTNCAKHSHAKAIDIEVANPGDHVTLIVKDDGIGFDLDTLQESGKISGLGLITMKERAEFIGGKFFVTSHPLTGTEIRVELGIHPGQNRAGSLGFDSQSSFLLHGPGRSSLN
jgi:PAS domain S-box-containing protein